MTVQNRYLTLDLLLTFALTEDEDQSIIYLFGD